MSTSLSGDTASLGQDLRDVVTLAVEDFGGRIRASPLVVAVEDDGCTDAEKSAAAANRLVADPAIVAVVGPMCSNGAQAANPVYERAGLVHISASASMPSLTEEGSKVFFRTVWRDDRQGTALANYALDDLGARKAVVITDGGSYGEAVATAFARRFEEGGGQVAREEVAAQQEDFGGLIGRIIEGEGDAVLFAGFAPPGAVFLRQLREAGYGGAFLAPDSLFDVTGFVEGAGAAAEGAVIVAGAQPPEELAARFKERFGRDPLSPFIGQGYDAATALLTVIEAVAVEEDGRLTIDRTDLLTELRARSFEGRTGPIRFDARGDRVGASPEEIGLALYVVDGGGFALVERAAPATTTPSPAATATP